MKEFESQLQTLEQLEGPLTLNPVYSLKTQIEPWFYVLAAAAALLIAVGVLG